jgi:hypothetical protein
MDVGDRIVDGDDQIYFRVAVEVAGRQVLVIVRDGVFRSGAKGAVAVAEEDRRRLKSLSGEIGLAVAVEVCDDVVVSEL